MNIFISNSSKEPIYEQIKKQIKQSIYRGEVQEGDLLPSIRQLAKDLQISVITTKRAYEDLEREGYITSVVGKGSFIAGQNMELIREKRIQLIEERLTEIVDECKELDVSLDQLKEIIELLYKEER
ncbi:GntR family transcriptional regulator [Paenibacillus ginsengihumi]|uniref:GntR family transcriptional regulator n=1 Tax=Paenibacillus ginsengihumi TaxID=431596 RepID=UPI00037B6E40|nr:GntR family transcriptional regulator [Paenibacillus ginsengihumi]